MAEELTHCKYCDKPIKAGEIFYSVSFGTSDFDDYPTDIIGQGNYCTNCGPMRPNVGD